MSALDNCWRENKNRFLFSFLSALVQLKVAATVDGKPHDYNWMVKSTPREPNRHLIARKFKLDEREVNFFKVLLPKLQKFTESKNCLDIFPKFCSIPFCAWNTKDKVLIMENLTGSGWRQASAGLPSRSQSRD